MNLKTVTITGADDSTSMSELVDLSAEFPFVEWGILVSRRQQGNTRFPSRAWIDRFASVASLNNLHLSTHVCGAWVRQMFTGELNWLDVGGSLSVSQRVQINTHAQAHASTMGLIESLRRESTKEFIFQWDGVNDHLTFATHAYGCKVAALFDTSGGAGILPENWPTPTKDFWCGYAGGLGPENIAAQIRKIEQVCKQPYWIDMERRVRFQDDSALNMQSVRQVLKTCAKISDEKSDKK